VLDRKAQTPQAQQQHAVRSSLLGLMVDGLINPLVEGHQPVHPV